MSQNLKDIKPGTILVSNHQTGPSYCQVTEFVVGRFGESLSCVQDGEFVGVSHVGNVDMKGIGWKLATESDIDRMDRLRASEYAEYAADFAATTGCEPMTFADWSK